MLEFIKMETTLAVREQAIGPLITTPEQCAKFLIHVENLAQEAFIVLTLNTKNRLGNPDVKKMLSLGVSRSHNMPNFHI